MNLMEFSDEILLHILRYAPVSDLVLNVRSVCRKLSVLSLDKSLTHTVILHKDYRVRKTRADSGVVGVELAQSRPWGFDSCSPVGGKPTEMRILRQRGRSFWS